MSCVYTTPQGIKCGRDRHEPIHSTNHPYMPETAAPHSDCCCDVMIKKSRDSALCWTCKEHGACGIDTRELPATFVPNSQPIPRFPRR